MSYLHDSNWKRLITSVYWIDDTSIAIADSNGLISIYDGETKRYLRKMEGHAARIGCMSSAGENQPWILTAGSKSGEIINFDVRKPNPICSRWKSHDQEVSGLKWSPDGNYLASGGNDNVVNIWANDVGDDTIKPLHELTEHTSSVKALAWCPWKAQVLASGGGTVHRFMFMK